MKTRELNQNMEIDSVEEAEEILKAAGTEDIFEKAHVHGEVHPNGRWYWDSNVSGGKGDWRVIKKRGEKKDNNDEKGGVVNEIADLAEKFNKTKDVDYFNEANDKISQYCKSNGLIDATKKGYYSMSYSKDRAKEWKERGIDKSKIDKSLKFFKEVADKSNGLFDFYYKGLKDVYDYYNNNSNEETGAKKERKIMENVFKLEDEYYENDEASTEEISKKMQKIIDSNDLSKRDFIRLYVKHGKDFAGGGGITNSDLKDSILNTIDALQLKFKK
jgi:hypothetical protein